MRRTKRPAFEWQGEYLKTILNLTITQKATPGSGLRKGLANQSRVTTPPSLTPINVNLQLSKPCGLQSASGSSTGAPKVHGRSNSMIDSNFTENDHRVLRWTTFSVYVILMCKQGGRYSMTWEILRMQTAGAGRWEETGLSSCMTCLRQSCLKLNFSR